MSETSQKLTCLLTLLQPDLEDMEELCDMRSDLMDRITNIMTKACDHRSTFDTYSYLWVDDRKQFMEQFLLYNHVLTPEEIEAHTEEGVPECPPTLDQFKEQVCTLVSHALLDVLVTCVVDVYGMC